MSFSSFWSSLFIWNVNAIIFYFGLGILTWMLVSLHKDIKDKVKHPKLVGLAFCLVGGFDIGLTVFVSAALYYGVIGLCEFWAERFRKWKHG